MGIYYRYAAAALILLFCADSYAVTRKTVNHGQTKASVINGNGASFQTPNGDAAYFGQDYVDEHTAGRRFNANDNPSGMSGNDLRAKQKVTVKPTLNVNPRAAAKAMTGAMRGGVPGVIASAAAAAIVDAVDGIIEDSQIKVPGLEEVGGTNPGDYYWTVPYPPSNPPTRYTSAVSACAANHQYYIDATEFELISKDVRPFGTGFYCDIRLRRPDGSVLTTGNATSLSGSSCPQGSTYNPNTGQCLAVAMVSPSDADWITMEDWAAVRDSDFVRDMVRSSCEGSNAPARCYDELSEWADLQGPPSQTGPAQVTTTTKTNPDGTTSTTTTTTQNRYEYNFGPNYYNYSTTTKITQNTDGVVTETETSDGIPSDTPTQQEESTDYTFNDSEFPEVPSFYQQKYPDGLEGVWQQARADIDQSAFMQFLQGFIPSFSGSCPAFGLGFNIASWANYGTVQFSSICYVLDFVKIILLVTAIFTFRKVTFGG